MRNGQTKKAKKPVTSWTITIPPVGNQTEDSSAREANSALQRVLSRKTQADIVHYVLPDESSNVFKRIIRVAKIPRKGEREHDVPDIEDVYMTDLPWFGNVTFKRSSRHLRSKYQLGVAVEMVREYGDFLYYMCDRRLAPKEHPPVMVWESHYATGGVEFHVETDVHEDDRRMYFEGAADVHPDLAKELSALGYVQDGNIFTVPGEPTHGEILVRLWGRRLRVDLMKTFRGMAENDLLTILKRAGDEQELKA